MTPDPDAMVMRRYLLGEADDGERERAERACFADESILERMEAVEETLIEDYLADRLSPDSRDRFERAFLSVPHRRARVETMRALIAVAARAHPVPGCASFAAPTRRPVMWAISLAVAAAVLIAVGTWWTVGVSRGRRVNATDAAVRSGAEASGQSRQPVHLFAVSLSPAGTRGASTTPDVIVPHGTDVLDLRLAAEPGDAPVEHGRAVVRTVSGDEVWSGPATSPSDRSAGMAASIALPALRLGPDDYVITLFAVSPQGAEREASRYFLRIVAR
jgi:hypothetical protein